MARTTIIRAACPGFAAAVPCAAADPPTIYIPPYFRDGPFTVSLWHERGHLVEYWLLDAAEHAEIAGALGFGSTWRHERFADAYASCHISERQRRKAGTQLGIFVPRRSRVPCRLIALSARTDAVTIRPGGTARPAMSPQSQDHPGRCGSPRLNALDSSPATTRR